MAFALRRPKGEDSFMKRRIPSLLLVLALLITLVPGVSAEGDTLTVETRTGSYSFRAGEEFTYSYWLRLSPEGLGVGALLSSAIKLTLANGHVYYDDSALQLVSASVPNFTSLLSFARDTSELTEGGGISRRGVLFNCNPKKNTSQETMFTTATNILVTCRFRVKEVSEQTAHIRTKLNTLNVIVTANGKDETLELVDGGAAKYPYTAYETVNDETPSVKVNTMVDDIAFDVRCCASEQNTGSFFRPGAGVKVSLDGASSEGRTIRLTGYTDSSSVIRFYDVPYGEYAVRSSFTAEDAVRYSGSAEELHVPGSAAQILRLFPVDPASVRDIPLHIRWVGDDGYLPVRPAAMAAALYAAGSEASVDALSIAREDTELCFEAVPIYDSEGRPIEYTVRPELVGGAKYSTDTSKNADGSFTLTLTYTGSKTELNKIPRSEDGHYWERSDALSTAANCKEEGRTVYICAVCSARRVETGRGAHSWGSYVTVSSPSCTQPGYEKHTCSVCGESETREIPALGHSYGAWFEVTGATCHTQGLRRRVCIRGDAAEEEPTEMLTHVWGEWSLMADVTCTENGHKMRSCSLCGDTDITEAAALGHDWGEWVSNGDATQEADGTRSRVCRRDASHIETEADLGSALKHTYSYYISNNDATCTQDGTKTAFCDDGCGQSRTVPDSGSALGHSWMRTARTEATCTQNAVETYVCTRDVSHTETRIVEGSMLPHEYVGGVCRMCGAEDPSAYVLTLTAQQLAYGNEVYIDGVRYTAENGIVLLPDAGAKTATVYSYNTINSDPHAVYPTHMTVYSLSCSGRSYTATELSAFSDLLQYAGSSIRITGVKGIRMITSVPKNIRTSLLTNRVEGYTLVEYGTLAAWDAKLGDGALVLGGANVLSNYAYSRANGTDPIYAETDSLVQFTNVLVGITDEKCSPDLALRPYMILEDASGSRITLYGGIIHRSIGYIAYQNRNAFTPGTEAYEYIWGIIHTVYGDAYDAEYKG